MENNKGSKFLNGFMIGSLIGAGAVFLLGTKKGKEVLKLISEEGLDNISSILEKADKSIGLDEVLDDEQEAENNKSNNVQQAETVKKPLIRRFFKRSVKVN